VFWKVQKVAMQAECVLFLVLQLIKIAVQPQKILFPLNANMQIYKREERAVRYILYNSLFSIICTQKFSPSLFLARITHFWGEALVSFFAIGDANFG
jgi:phosphate starvation-inducible membrane PsiE